MSDVAMGKREGGDEDEDGNFLGSDGLVSVHVVGFVRE